MSEAFIGQIQAVSLKFAPRGWISCLGQLLETNQHGALYSLIQTYYGGEIIQDYTRLFGLPNLVGRVPVHVGGTIGGSDHLKYWEIGEKAGTPGVTLSVDHLPPHSHEGMIAIVPTHASSPESKSSEPTPLTYPGFYEGPHGSGNMRTFSAYNHGIEPGYIMHENTVKNTGGSLPHENRQPFLALNFCICTEGLYPDRD